MEQEPVLGVNPRVNGAILGQFAMQNITLVGKVISQSGTNAVIQASDGAEVNVHAQGEFSRYGGAPRRPRSRAPPRHYAAFALATLCFPRSLRSPPTTHDWRTD
jgi:hypothetical protein